MLPWLRARDEGYFRDFLRMPPSTFDTLLGLVGPKIKRKGTPFWESISPRDRLAITLRFLPMVTPSQPLVQFSDRSANCSCDHQAKNCCDLGKIAADMELYWNFPNCIGSIDGKHINIECQDNTGSRNLSYKKTFSVFFLLHVMHTTNSHVLTCATKVVKVMGAFF